MKRKEMQDLMPSKGVIGSEQDRINKWNRYCRPLMMMMTTTLPAKLMITSMSKQGARWKGKVKRRGLCVTVPVSAGWGVCVSVEQRALLHYLI